MDSESVKRLQIQLGEVISRVEQAALPQLPIIPDKSPSAANLHHYMAFRQCDIAGIQDGLGQLGLTRFARAEGHILHSLHQASQILHVLTGQTLSPPHPHQPSPDQALKLLAGNTRRLLGERPANRRMMIMVTLPAESATDPSVSEQLVSQGMNCARINCAHDTPGEWRQMISHVRTAAARTGKPVRVAMDLGGPKIRTGPIQSEETDKKGRPFQLLQTGDLIRLTGDQDRTESQHLHIPMTLPSVLHHVQPAERVFFDDGKVEALIRSVDSDGALLEIVRARPEGSKLRADKGINFPDSEMNISGLTDKDKEDFIFVAKHADLVNFSFVNSTSDLDELFTLIDLHDAHDLGVVLKIETRRAYNRLSSLLMHTMTRPNPFGVMIARGDLAIEAGWENMGYIQRELLRISTAAHLPIIWATQVLENLARRGVPARSEMTDIAQSMKAECVMLNKGPYINEALSFLDQFLIRGEAFQQKNKSMLPSLHELI